MKPTVRMTRLPCALLLFVQAIAWAAVLLGAHAAADPWCRRPACNSSSCRPEARTTCLCRPVGYTREVGQSRLSDRPNVLVILADDLGYGDLGCYGATDLATPHIDRLAAEGMRWTSFYANCTVCSPTRASLMTGRYPDLAGVPGVIRTHAENSWGYLDPAAELLPAALKQAGYRTGMVGKWHLGLGKPNLPLQRGLDFFHGFLGDMMDDYFSHLRHGVNYMRLGDRPIEPAGHATDLFTRWACQWLAEQKQGQPFFLYLAYNAPHNPIQPPPERLAAYRRRHPAVPAERAALASLIEHLDAGVGEVLDTLDAKGLASDTLVIFSSDNGGALPFAAHNGIYRDGKTTLYEGGIRVPMLARWPGHVGAGSQTGAVGLTMDLYPTICQLAGLPAAARLDGLNLRPILEGQAQATPQRELFWCCLENGRWSYAIRRGDYKLVQARPGRPWELFDLARDPRETTDLAAREPARMAALKAALDARIAAGAKVPYRDGDGRGPGEINRPPAKATKSL